MKLIDLLNGIKDYEIDGNKNVEISSVVYDSRKVREGSLFICVKGFVSDGHEYITQAINAKASAILVQDDIDVTGITKIKTSDTRRALAIVSSNYFDNPSNKLNMIGITGTKGKTTAAFMVNACLEASNRKTGLIGTILHKVGDKKVYASRTTPESYDLQSILSECAKSNVSDCVMEVSSQGLWLDRVYGIHYNIGVFTNIYYDHIGINEHENMDDYVNAKSILCERIDNGVVNIDANYSDVFVNKIKKENKAKLITVGIEKQADVMAKDMVAINTKNRIGTQFNIVSPWYSGRVFVGMPGKFNVYNAICAIACAGICNIPFEDVKKGLETIVVRGRVEPVITNRDFSIIVDYAHNAASLENLLSTLREHTSGRVISVFGCGGDRAKSRRFQMGEVSGNLADFTVITSDNPRTENPESILLDIETGVKKTAGKYIKIIDRTDAIEYAVKNAKANDLVVIAGKGHETYQIFADKTIHYDDVEVAKQILNELDENYD